MNKFHRERELYSWCCFKYNLSGITRYGHKGHGNLIIWRSLVVKYTWRLGINYGKTTRRKLRHRAIDIFTGRMKKKRSENQKGQRRMRFQTFLKSNDCIGRITEEKSFFMLSLQTRLFCDLLITQPICDYGPYRIIGNWVDVSKLGVTIIDFSLRPVCRTVVNKKELNNTEFD